MTKDPSFSHCKLWCYHRQVGTLKGRRSAMVSRSYFAFSASYQCATDVTRRTTAGYAYICRRCSCTSGSPKCFPVIENLVVRERGRSEYLCVYLSRDRQETRVHITFFLKSSTTYKIWNTVIATVHRHHKPQHSRLSLLFTNQNFLQG